MDLVSFCAGKSPADEQLPIYQLHGQYCGTPLRFGGLGTFFVILRDSQSSPVCLYFCEVVVMLWTYPCAPFPKYESLSGTNYTLGRTEARCISLAKNIQCSTTGNHMLGWQRLIVRLEIRHKARISRKQILEPKDGLLNHGFQLTLT